VVGARGPLVYHRPYLYTSGQPLVYIRTLDDVCYGNSVRPPHVQTVHSSRVAFNVCVTWRTGGRGGRGGVTSTAPARTRARRSEREKRNGFRSHLFDRFVTELKPIKRVTTTITTICRRYYSLVARGKGARHVALRYYLHFVLHKHT